MSEPRSRYYDLLVNLGFAPFDRSQLPTASTPLTASIATLHPGAEADRNATSAQPLYIPEGSAVFVMMRFGAHSDVGMTIAYDECDQAWLHQGEAIDLSGYGFVNILTGVTRQ